MKTQGVIEYLFETEEFGQVPLKVEYDLYGDPDLTIEIRNVFWGPCDDVMPMLTDEGQRMILKAIREQL